MFPVALRLGSFEISSFGVMVAAGALVGLLVLRRELVRSGLDAAKGVDAAVLAVLGGMLGAKLLFVAEHAREPLRETLFARGGLSWFGGLVGGVLVGALALSRARLPLLGVLSAAAPAVAVGQALGRVGCLLVGDDYGRPSPLPWAIAFPRGLPPTLARVHPTQVYEMAGLLVTAWLLVRFRKRGMRDVAVVASYLVLAGGLRFAIEWVRVDRVVFLGLTVAHIFSLFAVAAGLVLLALCRPVFTSVQSRSQRTVAP